VVYYIYESRLVVEGQNGNLGGLPMRPNEVQAGVRSPTDEVIAELWEALQDKAPWVTVAAAEQISEPADGMPASRSDVTLWHKVAWATAHI
jgi:hypothetical protein